VVRSGRHRASRVQQEREERRVWVGLLNLFFG
jgi:hypothetical protein